MKKTRIAGRIIAGAVASAVLLGGSFAAPAQADTGGGGAKTVQTGNGKVEGNPDTGWGGVRLR